MKKFIITTFVLSWVLWLPGVLSSQDIDVPEVFLAIGMLASFIPSFAGLFFAWREGKLRDMWRRVKDFEFSKILLIPVLLLIPSTAAVSYYAALSITGEGAVEVGIGTIITGLTMFFIGGPLGEEFGWRGFLLDKMLDTYSALKSGLLIGFIWGLWHLPLHFITGTAQEWVPIWAYILIMMLNSVMFTWIFINTKRNILIAMLFHWSTNLAVIFFPYWQIGSEDIDTLPNLWMPTSGMLIGFVVLLIFVILVVAKYKSSLKQYYW